MSQKVENPFHEKYIRIYSNLEKNDEKDVEWVCIHPILTFDEYNKQFYKLVNSIEKWLKQHSEIKIDLNMSEAEKYKTQNE